MENIIALIELFTTADKTDVVTILWLREWAIEMLPFAEAHKGELELIACYTLPTESRSQPVFEECPYHHGRRG